MDNQEKSFPERFFQQVFGFGIRCFATIFLGWAAIPTLGVIIGSYMAIWGQGPTLPFIEYFVDDQGNVDTNYFLISFVVLILILTIFIDVVKAILQSRQPVVSDSERMERRPSLFERIGSIKLITIIFIISAFGIFLGDGINGTVGTKIGVIVGFYVLAIGSAAIYKLINKFAEFIMATDK